MKDYMAGIDLHSNNLVLALVNLQGERIAHHRVPCDLAKVLATLLPYRERLDTLAIESTYNWYWLADGLQDAGYHVVLANPAGVVTYTGLKHTDDADDAYLLAELLRLNILPQGQIYDRQLRPVRDLLRRRLLLVRQRTALYLSLGSLHARMHGAKLPLKELKALEPKPAMALFTHPADQLVARTEVELLRAYDEKIERIEKAVLAVVKELPCYPRLKTLPGVGLILALTISLEVGDIGRFAGPGLLASYSRCVESRRISNGKKKGENNAKAGNKYLAWAFIEAANFAKRFDEQCRRYWDRKAAQRNVFVATKALANKLCQAAWHLMSAGSDYDAARMFPGGKTAGSF